MKVFEDTLKCALLHSFKLLGYRDRSEKEMCDKLARKGFSAHVVAEAVAYLKEKGFVDDTKLAAMLEKDAAERRYFGGRGVRAYLQKRGIPAVIIASVVDGREESVDMARALIEKNMKTLGTCDRETIKRRLWSALARKGFSVDTIHKAMKSYTPEEDCANENW
jgi:regulatory protein